MWHSNRIEFGFFSSLFRFSICGYESKSFFFVISKWYFFCIGTKARGQTSLIVCDSLITNFHQIKSTFSSRDFGFLSAKRKWTKNGIRKSTHPMMMRTTTTTTTRQNASTLCNRICKWMMAKIINLRTEWHLNYFSTCVRVCVNSKFGYHLFTIFFVVVAASTLLFVQFIRFVILFNRKESRENAAMLKLLLGNKVTSQWQR